VCAGFDPAHCEDVTFTNSIIATGDDCIAVKAGYTQLDWSCGRPSTRMRFENLTCVHSHGLTIGSEMSGGISEILFKNITIGEAFAAVRIKSARGRGGFVRNVRYEGIRADSVLSGVWIDMNYAVVPECSPKPEGIPLFDNITVANVDIRRQVRALPLPFPTTSSGINPGAAFTLVGLPESSLRNVHLHNITVHEFVQSQDCAFAEIVSGTGLSPPLVGNASTRCVTPS
jgi:polygalacturonase